ncbi:aspartate/glutamate racemase family protein [Micromonospora sp. SCSIO 07396]
MHNNHATIGIIGGLGPRAGAYVYERLVRMTPARSDQEHPEVVLLSRPFPSRIAHLVEAAESPEPHLVNAVRSLQAVGCRVVALASATTHAYREAIQRQTDATVVDGVRTVADLLARSDTVRTVVICTIASRRIGIFERSWPRELGVAYPDEADQPVIDGLIDRVKSGNSHPSDIATLQRLVRRYTADGAACVLGCTELPVLWQPEGSTSRVVSVSDAIAVAALAAAGYLRLDDHAVQR